MALHLMRAPSASSGCVGANNRAMSGSDSARSTARVVDITPNRPAIGAVALPIALHILHNVVEGSRIVRSHTIFELNHQRAAPVCQQKPLLRIASISASSPRSVMAGMRSQRPSSGKSSINPAEASSVMSTPTASVRRPQP